MNKSDYRKAAVVQAILILVGFVVAAVLMAKLTPGGKRFDSNMWLIGVYLGGVGIACAYVSKRITDRLWPESRVSPPSLWSKMTPFERVGACLLWTAYVAFAFLSIYFGMDGPTFVVVLILAWIPIVFLGKVVERRAEKRSDSSISASQS